MELIKIKNAGYDRYEELLLERDALKKEAFAWKQEYTRIFGERMLQLFEKKIACIQKKKTIAFCQTFLNRGEAIDRAVLRTFIETEMEEYNKQLQQMVVTAYRVNRLKDLEEAEVLIHRALEKLAFGQMEIEIPNLAEKIQEVQEEIRTIKETTPYQYRYLLEDEEAVEKRMAELKKEQQEYETYEKELERIMDELVASGVQITWHWN